MKTRTDFFRIIPFIYLIIGPIWFIGLDYLLSVSNYSAEKVLFLDIFKSLFFVFFTSILLFVLLKNLKNKKQIEEEKEKLTLLIDTMPDCISFKDGGG
ncbi:MAG TPA: two-component sensor histidine kinase, partial [Paenisporosarcina sp.]|nr:two-component sensor histidine kinase [Paenisporosarcina sp.]